LKWRCRKIAKKLFQLYLDEDQVEYIRKLADESGESRASIVRELIKKEMEVSKNEGK
jgi:hypothetical protein